ncbi:MAG: hypothetical protein ACFFDN_00485 [Candidatus Hodarchaeota archaeon]
MSEKIEVGNSKNVEKTKKGIQLDFEPLLLLPKSSDDFTLLKQMRGDDRLSVLQKQAIKNIEKYWLNRIRNYNNWKSSKHWGYKEETVSSRIEFPLYQSLKKYSINKIVQDFVRLFLRNKEFREEFRKKLSEQYEKDLKTEMGRIGMIKEELDHTAFMQELIRKYPYVVSGSIKTIEKELFVFYCYHFTGFSISYILRCALLHFRDIEYQKPLSLWKKYEALTILREMLEELES